MSFLRNNWWGKTTNGNRHRKSLTPSTYTYYTDWFHVIIFIWCICLAICWPHQMNRKSFRSINLAAFKLIEFFPSLSCCLFSIFIYSLGLCCVLAHELCVCRSLINFVHKYKTDQKIPSPIRSNDLWCIRTSLQFSINYVCLLHECFCFQSIYFRCVVNFFFLPMNFNSKYHTIYSMIFTFAFALDNQIVGFFRFLFIVIINRIYWFLF